MVVPWASLSPRGRTIAARSPRRVQTTHRVPPLKVTPRPTAHDLEGIGAVRPSPSAYTNPDTNAITNPNLS
eukprot:scaffold57429_cov42-Phaeocystis_antarctica.AAC.1